MRHAIFLTLYLLALSGAGLVRVSAATGEAFEAFFPGVQLKKCHLVELPKLQCQAMKTWIVEMADRLWQARNFRAHDRVLAYKNNSALQPLTVVDGRDFIFRYSYDEQKIGDVSIFLDSELENFARCIETSCRAVLIFPVGTQAAFWADHVRQAQTFLTCAYRVRQVFVEQGTKQPKAAYIYSRISRAIKGAIFKEDNPVNLCKDLSVDPSIVEFSLWNLPDSAMR